MRKSKNLLKAFLLAGLFSASLLSCSKKDNGEPETFESGTQNFVFVVTSEAASEGGGAGSYVVATDNVTEGTLSVVGNGIPSNEYSFLPQNNYVFGMVYGDQGPITPYGFNDAGVLKRFDDRTVNAIRPGIYGTYGDKNIIIGSTNRNITSPIATLMNYNTETFSIQAQNTVNLSTEVAGSGRMAIWTGLFQVGDKIYVPYQIADGTSTWGGNILEVNKSTIAIFSYPDLKLVKTISDDRGSFIGNWGSQQGVGVTPNGDAYTWFTSGTTEAGLVPRNPSGILRIKSGTDAFDSSYFFDVEALGKGKIARGNHIIDNKFLMTMYTTSETGGTAGGKVNLAIVDAEAKTLKEVTGIPAHDQSSYNNKVYVEKDGKTAYYLLQDDAGEYYVYVIDLQNSTAKRGLHLVGITDVSAFTKLNVN
ncbi:DUF4374 domain-containing protein [Pedobacter sp. AW31-3R]|uniref:DUF4374 domain-containing protein n=1 Tax=Pedobacter sp. AW31-3R TaxID=3445781 RepID=UPI003FA1020D